MVEGISGIGPITRFDASELPSQIAGELPDFRPTDWVSPRDAKRMGQFAQYAIAASDMAMVDAGYDAHDLREGGSPGKHWPVRERLGVYVGSGIGGFPEIVREAHSLRAHGMRKGVSPLFIPRSLANLAAGYVAMRLHARGPSLCVTTACAVGNHTIGEAWRAIRDGDADVIVAGGAEASLSPLGYAGFMNMRALSKRNDDPARASRPFDVDRDGFAMSEGAASLVLESRDHALRRGARIYAEVIGYGLTTDAHHITAPSPRGEGAARCMVRAMEVAGIHPEEVDYVNAHGTSTPANDVAETQAIRSAFGKAADSLMVSSTKGVTGHLLGAAGGIEALATCMALRTSTVPPTANLENPDPQCDLDYVQGEARNVPIQIAMSNAFGFGGTNAVLVFRKHD